MGSRERFLFYNKDFETCKVLQLRICGNNGSKLEQCSKHLSKFPSILGIFLKYADKTGYFQLKLVNFWQEFGVCCNNWVFLAKITFYFCQELGIFWVKNG